MIGQVHICDTLFVTDPQIDKALRGLRRAEAAVERRRQELADAVGEAIAERDVRQVDVVKQTGYTRETIRRWVKDYVDRKVGQSQPF